MVYCVAYGCTQRSGSTEAIRFHTFPHRDEVFSRELLKNSVPSVFNFPERLQKNGNPRRPLVRKRKEDDSSESSFSKQSATTTKTKKRKVLNVGKGTSCIITVIIMNSLYTI